MATRSVGDDLPDVGTVLITGPPMTGKYRLFLSLLSRRCDRVGIISTQARSERIRDDFSNDPAGLSRDRIGVIDCVRRPRHSPVPDDDLVSSVASPRNLTEIGIKFTELAAEFQGSAVDGRTGIGLYSVSQLLMFSSAETVSRFLQVLTEQVSSNGWFGAAVLDETTAEDETIGSVEHLFEAVIETRERDDGTREFRVRTLSSPTNGWAPLTV